MSLSGENAKGFDGALADVSTARSVVGAMVVGDGATAADFATGDDFATGTGTLRGFLIPPALATGLIAGLATVALGGFGFTAMAFGLSLNF